MKRKILFIIVAVCTVLLTVCGCTVKQKNENPIITDGLIAFVYSNEGDFNTHINTVPDSRYDSVYYNFLHAESTYFIEVAVKIYRDDNTLDLGSDEVTIAYDNEVFEIVEFSDNGLAHYRLETKSKTGETVITVIDKTGYSTSGLKNAVSLKIWVY